MSALLHAVTREEGCARSRWPAEKGKPAAIDIAAELQQAKQMAANMEKGMEKMEQWRLEDKQRQDERDAQQQARKDKRDADSKALMGQLFSILDKFK